VEEAGRGQSKGDPSVDCSILRSISYENQLHRRPSTDLAWPDAGRWRCAEAPDTPKAEGAGHERREARANRHSRRATHRRRRKCGPWHAQHEAQEPRARAQRRLMLALPVKRSPMCRWRRYTPERLLGCRCSRSKSACTLLLRRVLFRHARLLTRLRQGWRRPHNSPPTRLTIRGTE